MPNIRIAPTRQITGEWRVSAIKKRRYKPVEQRWGNGASFPEALGNLVLENPIFFGIRLISEKSGDIPDAHMNETVASFFTRERLLGTGYTEQACGRILTRFVMNAQYKDMRLSEFLRYPQRRTELLRIHRFGDGSLLIVEKTLEAAGMSFGE